MSKNHCATLLSLITALVLACGTQTASTPTRAPATAPLLPASQEEIAPSTVPESKETPSTAPTQSPQPTETQPIGVEQLLLARSADGLKWETFPDPIRQHASAPEIALLESGDLMIYFTDGAVDNLAAIRLRPEAFRPWDSIPPQGEGLPPTYYQSEAWEDVELSFDYPPTEKMLVPDLVVIPYAVTRLFFFGANMPSGKPDDPHIIYSAMGASDGTYFGVDMGERISLPGITDPSVVYLSDSSWLMALSRGTETVLAHSEDGGSFTETGVVVKSGGTPELTVLPDGALRLYVTARGGITSLISSDGGQTWTEEEGLRIQAQPDHITADPSVIQISDSNWLMVWAQ